MCASLPNFDVREGVGIRDAWNDNIGCLNGRRKPMRRTLFVLVIIGVAVAAGAAGDAGQKNASNSRADTLKALDDLSTQHGELEKIHADYVHKAERLAALYGDLDKAVAKAGKLAAPRNPRQVNLNSCMQSSKCKRRG
jgi:hypothetical protein